MLRKTFQSLTKNSKRIRPLASTKIAYYTPSILSSSLNSGIAACGLFSFPSISRGFAAETTKTNSVIELESIEQWEELLANPDQAYCIDFYADWCGPCRQLVPLLIEKVEKLATADSAPIILVKVNVDNFQDIAQALGVSTIPHVFLVKGGEAVHNFIGRKPSAEIDEIFAKVL